MSDYKIIDVNERDPSGTSLKGYIQEDYSTLVQAFGEPHYQSNDGDKVFTSWELEFTIQEDGEEDTTTFRSTIYDWKEDSPRVAKETPKYQWHVGGDHYLSVDAVQKWITQTFSS
jgi:hypothetical protein